mmetsp:Transcript_2319/g.3648  ORF Transcript_2319/g.3648 Transcript_2319/m.3648 type:complete len:220 (-) Transcript_2319:504-1163(-)
MHTRKRPISSSRSTFAFIRSRAANSPLSRYPNTPMPPRLTAMLVRVSPRSGASSPPWSAAAKRVRMMISPSVAPAASPPKTYSLRNRKGSCASARRLAMALLLRNPFTSSSSISSYCAVPRNTSMSGSLSTTENLSAYSFTAAVRSALASSYCCSLTCAQARLYSAARDSSSLGAPKLDSAAVKFATASAYLRFSKHARPLLTASAEVVLGPMGVGPLS